MPYDRQKAVGYAHRWAYSRNPAYYDFEDLGGDCTNFISQCIHAGDASMNYTPTFGWYYISLKNRTPAWSGVEFLYNFLTTNQGKGPYAVLCRPVDIQPGDIVQLSFDGNTYGHSLFVVSAGTPDEVPDNSNIRIATHTFNCDYYPLDNWENVGYRYMHVLGAR